MTLEKNGGRTTLAVHSDACEQVFAHLPVVSALVTSACRALLFTFSGTRGKTLLENEFAYSSYEAYI